MAGLLVAGFDLWMVLPWLPKAKTSVLTAPPLVALLASLYGSINEELLVRLFLLTGLAWGLSWPARRRGERPAWVFGAAILGSALLFGVLHLPAAAHLWDLTPLVVARVVGLNLLLGVGFGTLYVRHGLLAAMCAHFGADIGLHVLGPAMFT